MPTVGLGVVSAAPCCNNVVITSLLALGYRHPSPTTVARTVRILHTLLGLVGKHRQCDRFEVNTQSVAYLAGED